MLENSYISDRNISKSMTRLNKISSDNKFRVKSLRLKTQEKLVILQSPTKKQLFLPSLSSTKQLRSPSSSNTKLDHLLSTNIQLSTLLVNKKLRVKSSLLQKDYEQLLIQQLKIPKNIIQELFTSKLKQDQIKITQQKYFHFCKNFYNRLSEKVQLMIDEFNFKGKTLEKFLNFYITWKQKNIIALDISLCSELACQIKTKQQEEQQIINLASNPDYQEVQSLWPKNNLLTRLILEDQRLAKICVRNMHFSPQQMVDFLTSCLKSKRIYSIDISNKTSQTINRIGSDYYYIEAFFSKNQLIGRVKMDNLNVTDQCIQKISNGITKSTINNSTPLKILSLANNLLGQNSLSSIFTIMKSGITELNISSNPLGPQFFMQIKNLRTSTVKNLDLCSVNMNSQSLINFLQQICQNKSLEVLKLDNNDFSHHWFNKIKDIFQNGFSLQYLSLASCGIRNFDTLFEGLIHSKSLKRLNLNYNLVNIQEESIQKVIECLKQNKVLKQLRIRFCGYNQPLLIQFVEALKINKSLQVIDISQNHMSDEGGKYIIKILSENKIIRELGIQKLQFTVRMTEQIQKIVAYNNQVRQKEQIKQLVNQNNIYKSKDTFSWSEIQKLQAEGKKLQFGITQGKIRKEKLQKKIQKKKQFILDMRKQFKEQQKNLDKQIRRQQQKNAIMQKKYDYQIQRIMEVQNQNGQALDIEDNLIRTLEFKIKRENQRIKKRENQLQDQLRDQKYLQKRKQKIQKSRSSGTQSKGLIQSNVLQNLSKGKKFDNTKSIVAQSKRKNSSHNSNKKN